MIGRTTIIYERIDKPQHNFQSKIEFISINIIGIVILYMQDPRINRMMAEGSVQNWCRLSLCEKLSLGFCMCTLLSNHKDFILVGTKVQYEYRELIS